jgi:hypothetical protein
VTGEEWLWENGLGWKAKSLPFFIFRRLGEVQLNSVVRNNLFSLLSFAFTLTYSEGIYVFWLCVDGSRKDTRREARRI